MAAASRPPPSKPLNLELTIISAKHLKNVNWRNGDLQPYAVFWVDPERRLSTRSDDSGSIKPVWNERFALPLTLPLHDSVLTLEIFHSVSKSSETLKPLVATLRVELADLPDPENLNRIRTYTLLRPSGRPQGKIRVKLALQERPLPPPQDYRYAPPPNYYYTNAPPPPYSSHFAPPPPPPHSVSPPPPPPPPAAPYSSFPEGYSPYYSGHYYVSPPPPMPPPPMPPRPFLERSGGYGGPSAPLDYSPYEKPRTSSRAGFGTGLAVGAAAGALGGLALDEGLKYEEERVADRVDHEVTSRERDDYSDYRRADY